MRREGRIVAGLLAFSAVLVLAASAQIYLSDLPLDHPAIAYWTAPVDDPAAKLTKQIGEAKLDLANLLDRLNVPIDSQALVFAKDSFQAALISPRNPRAIYFNDEVSVAWVRGSEWMEVAATDPRQGVIFYQTDGHKFIRSQACMKCHYGAATQGVPGMYVGSLYADITGRPTGGAAIITDHRTPFTTRWGGWYVNARRGEQPDRANTVVEDPAEPSAVNLRQNLISLEKQFNTSGYLAPVSDIVALMTFEHQTQMTNLLTRLGWKARIGKADDSDIEAVVRYMTFADEAPLKEPVEGVSSFTRTFAERGPFDHRGRSLRQFDLQTRLFRYPLGYMIYGTVFDALPAELRDRLYHRIFEALRTRPAALEILQETKPGLPDWWASAARAAGI